MSKLTYITAGFVVAFGFLFATSRSGVTTPHTPEGSFVNLVPPWPVFNVAVKINSFFSTAARVTTPPDVAALNLATAWWKSEVAYALAYNGIFDAVASKSGMTCGEVATSLDLQEFVVCQYMEAGLHLNVLDKVGASYSLTPVGEMFRKENLQSFLLMINEETRESWRGASTTVMKSGKISGFQAAFGKDVWVHYHEHSKQGAQFDTAMKSLAPVPTGAMISDWKPPRDDLLLCDIGGGLGHAMAHILEHYPNMRGMVFDLPKTAKGSADYLKEKGLSDRAEAVGGDFLKGLPDKFSECDVYHLRYIIHDWPDEESLSILKNIKASAEKATDKTHKKSIIVMDHIIDTGASPSMELSKHLMSINMVASNPYGSRERSVSEYEEMFAAAGLSGATDTKVTPLRSILTLLEAEI